MSYANYKFFGHRRVEGYTEAPVFTLLEVLNGLQRQLNISGPVTEVGVHHGRLFIAMLLLQRPDEPAVAIDLFDEQELNLDQSGKGDLEKFKQHVAHWSDRAVTIVQGDSTQLTAGDVAEIAGTRLFSVDGGHTADIVASDMRLASESLCDGGIMIADDVFNPQWPDVCVGTLQYMADNDLVPFGIGFNKTLFTQARYAERYRRALRDRFDGYLFAALDKRFAGYDVVSLVKVPIHPVHLARRSDALRRSYHAMLRHADEAKQRVSRRRTAEPRTSRTQQVPQPAQPVPAP